MNTINTNVWKTDGEAFFPELCNNFVNVKKYDPNGVSIAVSGGGSRSYTATLGYTSALLKIKIGNKNAFNSAQYISTVSGGSFFFGAYLFARSAKYSNNNLLGKILEPYEIDTRALATTNLKNKNFMGRSILHTPVENYLLEGQRIGIANGYLWQYVIGRVFLTPYKLSNRFVSLNSYYYKQLKAQNPFLPKAIYPPSNAPFWICNSTLGGVQLKNYGRISIQFTPYYSGIPQFVRNINNNQLVGGNWIDTCAFGGTKIDNQQKNYSNKCKSNRVGLTIQKNHILKLANIVGNSTSAQSYLTPDDIKQIFGKYVNLNPYYSFWSPTTKKYVSYENSTYYTADGGDSDNTGIITLLQRRCKSIIAFDNFTEVVKDSNNICSLSLLALFGIENNGDCPDYPYPFNTSLKVFKTSDWEKVTSQFTNNINNGGPCYARVKLDVLPNAIQGVEGNYTVDLLVIVLAESTRFNSFLPKQITESFTNPDSQFYDFPYLPFRGKTYNTLFQYTLSQVNLLASYAYWSIHNTELKDVIMNMYSK